MTGMDIDNAMRTAYGLIQGQDIDAARKIFEEIVTVDPGNSQASFMLADMLRRLGRMNESINMLQRTVSTDPGHYNANVLLAHAMRGAGNTSVAFELYNRALRLKRGVPLNERPVTGAAFTPPATHPGDPAFCATTLHKLKHDAEQLRYLVARELIPGAYLDLASTYDDIMDEIVDTGTEEPFVNLTDSQRERIGTYYNMFLYNVTTPSLSPAPAVNPDLDTRSILDTYEEKSPGVAIIDDFLTPKALAALTRYCLESTVWFAYRYKRGYIGSFLEDGFSCGLLLQIADELRQRFPAVLRDHPLLYCWAYKYDVMHDGINLHADSAAVNVNFWITPEDANLDPDTGGLTVHRCEAPLEWDGEMFNRDADRIRQVLAENDSEMIHVRYRRNRAMMFHSNLFHETDPLRFKGGYENRRINITMLFGRRGS